MAKTNYSPTFPTYPGNAGAITVSDTNNLEAPCVIYVGAAGNVKVTTAQGTDVTFVGAQAGQVIPVQVIRVWSTGTTVPTPNTNLFGISSGFSFSQSAAWTPAALGAALALWLDAADASTITLNGSTVSQWNDKSGNNRHATQATAANQPTYTAAGLGGKPVVTFDAANPSLMNIPAGQLGGATEASLFWVQKNVNDPAVVQGSGSSFINKNFGGDSSANHVPWTDGSVYFQAFSTTRQVVGNLTPSFALPRIIEVESKNNLFNFFVDGTVQLTTSANTYANPSGGKVIGGDTQFITNFLGYAAELIVVSSILSVADRQRLEGYLAWKWDLEANLPAGHPFRNTPPTV